MSFKTSIILLSRVRVRVMRDVGGVGVRFSLIIFFLFFLFSLFFFSFLFFFSIFFSVRPSVRLDIYLLPIIIYNTLFTYYYIFF